MRGRRTLREVFRWPTLIAIISIAGLLSALIGDGFMDTASWTLLAVPVVVGLFHWRAR